MSPSSEENLLFAGNVKSATNSISKKQVKLNFISFILLQILGCYECRLYPFKDESPSVHHDIPGVVSRGYCVTSSTIRVEGSWVSATNRTAEVYGIPGYFLSGWYYKYCFERRRFYSKNVNSLQVFATCCTFYVPLLVILALYWKIYQTARKRIHRRRPRPIDVTANNNQVSNRPFSFPDNGCGDEIHAQLLGTHRAYFSVQGSDHAMYNVHLKDLCS